MRTRQLDRCARFFFFFFLWKREAAHDEETHVGQRAGCSVPPDPLDRQKVLARAADSAIHTLHASSQTERRREKPDEGILGHRALTVSGNSLLSRVLQIPKALAKP